MRRLSDDEAAELLRRYKMHAPSAEKFDDGYKAAIHIGTEPDGTTAVALTHGEFTARRMMPLGEFEAGAMAEEFRTSGNVPLSDNLKAMLTNVLVQAARMFESESLGSLELNPLYIRSKDYRVASVSIATKKKAAVKRRLAGGAHDAGAVFPYRPTARGR